MEKKIGEDDQLQTCKDCLAKFSFIKYTFLTCFLIAWYGKFTLIYLFVEVQAYDNSLIFYL